MKKRLLSRRGAAIELAIGVMLLMIAVSIVLLTNATIKHNRKKDDITQLESKVELYEVTDKILENPEIKGVYEGYYIESDYDTNNKSGTFKIKETDSEGNTVLTIEVEDGNIISWK